MSANMVNTLETLEDKDEKICKLNKKKDDTKRKVKKLEI
jgi:hypothetical protein